MKKLSKSLLSAFLLFLVLSTPSFAQYDNISIPTQDITPTPFPSPTAVSYTLPYPGLLPGTPLYPLKAFRDKLVEIFTTDPAKRSDFYLLQADKRFASSLDLFKENKDELAESTLSKSQNYLEKSMNSIGQAKKQRESVMDELIRVDASSRYQVQLIKSLIDSSDEKRASNLSRDLERAQELQNRAESINP